MSSTLLPSGTSSWEGLSLFPALVRFRGMVQDTSTSSEMYLSKSKGGACGGWGIELAEDEDGHVEFSDLRECAVLWAVSVPAQSAWCARELDGPVECTFCSFSLPRSSS